MKTIITKDGTKHHIDDAGNHFINGKCVNPKEDSPLHIGDTHPKQEDIVKVITSTKK